MLPVTLFSAFGGRVSPPLWWRTGRQMRRSASNLVEFLVDDSGVVGVLAFLPGSFLQGQGGSGNFSGFFAMFLILFVATGIGNGSTFRMVPVMFLTLRQRALGRDNPLAEVEGNRESAAVLALFRPSLPMVVFSSPRLMEPHLA